MSFLGILLLSTLTLGAPLVLAAMGGFTSERGGVINIALEGKMLMGACVTALVGTATGSAWMGLLAGIAASTALSLFHWLITQSYRVDHVVSGMAINAVALGGTNFLDKAITNPSASHEIPRYPIEIYYGLALLVPLTLWFVAKHTRAGLHLLAVGSDPDKARQMGVSPGHVRFAGLLATGLFCGLAGAMLVTNAGRFTDGMTSGRGFIALAALILGGWRPLPAMLACVGFGFATALQLQLQGTPLMGATIPSEVWQILPYVVTVIALAGALGKSRAPAGLGKP